MGVPISYGNQLLFRVLAPKSDLHESLMSFLLLLCGILVALWGWWKLLTKWKFYDGVFLLLVFGFVFTRQIMQNTGVPALFLQSELFDPKKFASSALNSSMGDLFLNAVSLLVVMVYFFRNFQRFRITSWLLHLSGTSRWMAGVFCFIGCFFALLFPYNFVEVIYHNSAVSLDITQSISFDPVRLAAFLSVLMACFSSFLFFHALYSVGRKLLDAGWPLYFSALVVAGIGFAIQFSLAGQDHVITLILGWVLLTIIRLYRSPENFQFSGPLFFYLICSLFVFSLQNAWAVKLFSDERQSLNQIRYAKGFLTDRDILGEYLLDQARMKIQEDPFIRARMSGPVYGVSAVMEKVRRVHLNRYFDRYEIRIDVAPGELKPDTTQSVFHPTGYSGVSYSIATEGNDLKKYKVAIPLAGQRLIGNIQLLLTLKRIIPDNVYPELLVDNRFSQVYRSRDLSYAIFKEDTLITRFGAFNYRKDFLEVLNQEALLTHGVDYQSFHHQGVEDADGSIAVVSAPAYTLFYFLADLSFWFVLGLAVLLIYQGIVGSIQLSQGVRFNYSARIQLFIFLAFLLPVVAVSVTTLTLIGRSSEETIKRDFLDRSEAISGRLAALMSGDSLDLTGDLEVWIEENAAAGKFDISVFSPGGILMATSQPTLFDDKLISPLMDRTAWSKLVLDVEPRVVTNEQIGKLEYSCAYSAVNSSTGALLAIVGLPFFESAVFLQKNQQLILSNILIVFLIVFLSLLCSFILGFCPLFTSPLRIIARALGQTTLSGVNKPIQWNSTDEIRRSRERVQQDGQQP